MQIKRIAPVLGLVIGLMGLLAWGDSSRWQYPKARSEDLVEEYHGTKVADPYRWLEQADSSETKAFVDAQNVLTRRFLDGPTREHIKARLTQVWDYPKYSAPTPRAGKYFFSKNEGLQNQSVLYVLDSLSGQPSVLIDPNALSEDGTVALSSTEYTNDGSLMAYGISVSGSDQKEIRVRSVEDARDLDDVLKWCKFSSIAWQNDKSGFFYNRYPTPGSMPDKRDEANYNKLYWHKLGTPQDQDPVIYERPDEKALSFGPQIGEDGQYLVVTVSRGSTPKNRLYYRPVQSNDELIKLIDSEDASYNFVENIDDVFYIHTDAGAARGRVIAIDLKEPGKENWKQIIPESADTLNSVRMINRKLVATYMHDARHVLKIFNLDGSGEKEIELPTIGSVGSISGEKEGAEMFFTFTSGTYPTTSFRYDFKGDQLAIFRKSEVKFDPAGYETRQLFATSKDGTKIPLFITHRKGIKLDGSNPAILGGYGGFSVGLGPRFSVGRIAWLEQGGIDVTAILRGGDEYGEEWHKAGMLGNKQNVFDDFLAAADFLCKEGYTSPRRLAIEGGSNGGLLVAACMLQKPDQFGAVLCHVPVTDMLRYHRFSVGRFWIPEYGNAEANPEHFKFLHAYSPLHNVKDGVSLPAILITTAEGDDRVVPAHARKFVATLQTKSSSPNPILLRTQTKAGHGGGKPTSKIIDETADAYAFLAKVLEMKWDGAPQSAGAQGQ